MACKLNLLMNGVSLLKRQRRGILVSLAAVSRDLRPSMWLTTLGSMMLLKMVTFILILGLPGALFP